MSNSRDYNILLLKVLAHDLLAPLTAVKWQTELLAKDYKKKDKRERYLNGIADSTELGIALTKHAHVAAKVLSDSYEVIPTEDVVVSTLIEQTANELLYQYERHALRLNIDIEKESLERVLDKELVTLLVWSAGKFFLSCTPPNTYVKAVGKKGDEQAYSLIMSADGIQEIDACIAVLEGETEFDEYDQKYVFATLMKEVAEKIGVTIQAQKHNSMLEVEMRFV
jgi:light-regulated signal transduction histidine kinase (bacteriophytochrome)